ncbi:unnamed protein product [Blepharisma stoltei]|uniref:Uncharacterized protein n=1 Tax=Blepharisma stoltei TaxID=1481888 RepID=A0AAU9IY26_9CILI|nr:unnamed protein product [Blepharisma stoltei]
MDSYLPLVIPRANPITLYYRVHQTNPETTLFVCSLEKPLKKPRVKKWFSFCGKIKSIETGEMTKKNQQIYYATVEFKKKISLKKSLDNVWLNQKIEELYGNKEMEVEPEIDDKMAEHIAKMEEGGFTMVLPKKTKKNKYNIAAVPESMDVELSKKRPRSEATNFYNFQVEEGKSLKRMKADEEVVEKKKKKKEKE